MKERPEEADPAIVAGLKQHGLLHIIEPERIVDRGATEKLAAAMTDVITSGEAHWMNTDLLDRTADVWNVASGWRTHSYGSQRRRAEPDGDGN